MIRRYRKYALTRETQKVRYREREEKWGEGDEEGVRITEIRDDEEEVEKNVGISFFGESAGSSITRYGCRVFLYGITFVIEILSMIQT